MILFLSLLFGIAIAGFCDNAPGWKQVFKDDFTTLDTNSWTIVTGVSSGLGRDAYLTTDNVYIENGHLVLRSQKQTVDNMNYTSGAIISQDKKYFSNARVCVSATLPGTNNKVAQGIWPAHWLMPNDQSCWPDHGEVDIMEMINGDGNVHGSYHWNAKYPNTKCDSSNSQVSQDIAISTWATTSHEYATEFTEAYVTYLVDSKVYVNFTSASSKPSPQFPVSPMYILLNTAVGGPWPGPPNSNTEFPAYHLIDYVAVAIRA